jgi:hypothetical protein
MAEKCFMRRDCFDVVGGETFCWVDIQGCAKDALYWKLLGDFIVALER